MDLQKVILNEVFYLKFKMPDYIFNVIKSEVEEIKNNKFHGALPYNQYLAGTLEHEYALFKSADAIADFFSHDRFTINGKRLKLSSSIKEGRTVPTLWVNFQKKYEYNPIHNHDGDISFVVWVNIPYTIEDEKKAPHAKSGTSSGVPAFSFLYSPPYPQTRWTVAEHRIEVDKSYEGTCILFPSSYQHMVTPFYTSDDYRISVSGNFVLE